MSDERREEEPTQETRPIDAREWEESRGAEDQEERQSAQTVQRAAPTQEEVGGAPLDLVSDKRGDDDVAVIQAADRAVGVHLEGEPGRARDADRSRRAHAAMWFRSTGAPLR